MSSPTRSCISREAMGSLRNPINTYGILGKSPSYLPGIDHIFPISFPFGGIWTCFLEGHVFFWGGICNPPKTHPPKLEKTQHEVLKLETSILFHPLLVFFMLIWTKIPSTFSWKTHKSETSNQEKRLDRSKYTPPEFTSMTIAGKIHHEWVDVSPTTLTWLSSQSC